MSVYLKIFNKIIDISPLQLIYLDILIIKINILITKIDISIVLLNNSKKEYKF